MVHPACYHEFFNTPRKHLRALYVYNHTPVILALIESPRYLGRGVKITKVSWNTQGVLSLAAFAFQLKSSYGYRDKLGMVTGDGQKFF